MVLPADALDVLCHDDGLLLVRVSRLQLQPLAVLILGKDILRDLPFIALDQRVGCLHYQLRAPIVLLQLEEPNVWVFILKVENIIYICSYYC